MLKCQSEYAGLSLKFRKTHFPLNLLRVIHFHSRLKVHFEFSRLKSLCQNLKHEKQTSAGATRGSGGPCSERAYQSVDPVVRFVPVELPPLLTAVARRRHAFRDARCTGLRQVVPVARRLTGDLEDEFLANGA